jgi:hypothetical protein
MTMRSMYPGLQDAPAPAASAVRTEATASTAAKEIPYDYVATFQLLGQAGNRVQDVINVSIDGAFVAVAIGYSFIPGPLPQFPPAVSRSNPRPAGIAPPVVRAEATAGEALATWLLAAAESELTLPMTLARSLLVRLSGIEFKYSVVDSGSGRELQNKPIHNLAGLGESTGGRPFRPLAKPMVFLPRSTIRIEVEEISAGTLYQGAQLYIVLHGYKILGHGSRP